MFVSKILFLSFPFFCLFVCLFFALVCLNERKWRFWSWLKQDVTAARKQLEWTSVTGVGPKWPGRVGGAVAFRHAPIFQHQLSSAIKLLSHPSSSSFFLSTNGTGGSISFDPFSNHHSQNNPPPSQNRFRWELILLRQCCWVIHIRSGINQFTACLRDWIFRAIGPSGKLPSDEPSRHGEHLVNSLVPYLVPKKPKRKGQGTQRISNA